MAYSEALADRIRGVLGRRQRISEKRMFGGLAFLVDGKMFCGVIESDLMARVGPKAWERALARPYARPMDFTGRPLTGYVYVAPPGVRTAASLRKWVEQALGYTRTLPGQK